MLLQSGINYEKTVKIAEPLSSIEKRLKKNPNICFELSLIFNNFNSIILVFIIIFNYDFNDSDDAIWWNVMFLVCRFVFIIHLLLTCAL